MRKKFNNIPEIFYNIAISNFLQTKEFFENKIIYSQNPFTKSRKLFLLAKNDKFLSAIYINLSICYQHLKIIVL